MNLHTGSNSKLDFTAGFPNTTEQRSGIQTHLIILEEHHNCKSRSRQTMPSTTRKREISLTMRQSFLLLFAHFPKAAVQRVTRKRGRCR